MLLEDRVDSQCIAIVCQLTELVDLNIFSCFRLLDSDSEDGTTDEDVRAIAASLTKLEALNLDELDVTNK